MNPFIVAEPNRRGTKGATLDPQTLSTIWKNVSVGDPNDHPQNRGGVQVPKSITGLRGTTSSSKKGAIPSCWEELHPHICDLLCNLMDEDGILVEL